MRHRQDVLRKLTNFDGAARRVGDVLGLSTLLAGLRTDVDAKLPVSSIASQAEAEAGVENTHYMTPLRVAQALAALDGQPWYLFSEATVSGASNVDFETGLTDADYTTHIIEFDNVTLATSPDPSGGDFTVELKKNGSYGDTVYGAHVEQSSDTAQSISTGTPFKLHDALPAAATSRFSGRLIVRGHLLTAAYGVSLDFQGVCVNTSGPTIRFLKTLGFGASAYATTGIRFAAPSNISGNFRHYGIPSI